MNRSRPTSPRARQRGVTLVELITVIVIIGAVGAMTVPRWFDRQVFEQRGYVEDLASALRHAQRSAIASECQVQLTISIGGYSGMQRDVLNTCNTAGAWMQPVPRLDGTPLAATAPAGVLTSPATTVVFERDGTVSVGAPSTLTVGSFTVNVADDGIVTLQP